MNVQISRLINIGLAFIVLLIFGSWGNTYGQPSQTQASYSISGHVTDSSNPIAGVTISATFNLSLVYLPAVMNGEASTRGLNPAIPASGLEIGKWNRNDLVVSSPEQQDRSVLSGSVYSTTTDLNGDYYLGGLPTGVYTITASHKNYSFIPISRTVTLQIDTTDLWIHWDIANLFDRWAGA